MEAGAQPGVFYLFQMSGANFGNNCRNEGRHVKEGDFTLS